MGCYILLKKKKNLKDFNKSGIILKLQPSGILQREIFLKKEELKLKKMRMKAFYSKLLKIANFDQKLIDFVLIYKIFPPK